MSQILTEHLEYLALPGRTQLFRAAVAQCVETGDLVADLGCGVGVLGVLCLEAGAGHVWGIDDSTAIHLARESVKLAGFSDQYDCIANSTFRANLPQQVDLIICDHVGFFGFDYGIIGLLRDARRRFLKQGGKMIPQSLDLIIAGVSSDACRAKADAWSQDTIPLCYRWISSLSQNVRYAHELEPADLICASVALGHVDFADDQTDFYRFEAVLTAQRPGRFDGIAGWFDCQLAGSTRMTNSPLALDSIRRAQAFLPAQESFAVAVGDEIGVALRFRAEDNLIAWSITPPRGAPRQQMSTFNSMILTPADLAEESGHPLVLNPTGEARAFVLAQVDGTRTSDEIIARVLSERPDLLPSEGAIRDFIKGVIAHDCIV